LVLFRRQLSSLLARPFSSLRAGPLEVVWEQQVAEVEAELLIAEPPTSWEGTDDSATEDLRQVARLSPAAAVVRAFARIEKQLLQLMQDAGVEPGRGPVVQTARRSLEAGLVTPETVRAIEGVAVLRNLAAHDREPEIDEARALDYIALTDGVSFALSSRPSSG
jgi:hypothetical protein